MPAAAIRGGNWNNETNAGAFAMNLNNGPSNWNNNIGFRCCLGSVKPRFGAAGQTRRPHGAAGRACSLRAR